MNKSGAPRAANTNPSSMRAPILVALPSTREREVLSVAKGQQVFVDGVTAVIRVHPEYGEWEQSSRSLERVHHALQGAVQKRQALRPRRSGVGQRERVQESAVGRSAAVGDEGLCSRNPGLTPLHSYTCAPAAAS
jgi:hypothetical protein